MIGFENFRERNRYLNIRDQYTTRHPFTLFDNSTLITNLIRWRCLCNNEEHTIFAHSRSRFLSHFRHVAMSTKYNVLRCNVYSDGIVSKNMER